MVFVGDGGCGKTTALWQLLQDALAVDPPQMLAHMVLSQGSLSSSFSAIVERWRGFVTPNGEASDTLAMERLKRANAASPLPIVLLGLDGVDETHLNPNWKASASRVLRFFWELHRDAKRTGQIPPARLFISCRKPSDVSGLLPSPTGEGLGEYEPKYIYFSEFTRDELDELLRRSANVEAKVAERIRKPLTNQLEFAQSSGELSALTAPEPHPDSAWSDLLRHPILWRSFTSLNSADQLDLLDGIASAEDRLAQFFLEWFCDRVHHRINLETGDVAIGLKYLANKFDDPDAVYSVSRWIALLKDAAGLTEVAAMQLYGESISSGLIYDIGAAGGKLPMV